MADVAVQLLGGFEAAVDGEPVPEEAWRLKKARELVKLLALAPGRGLHREQAMELLWRDRGPDAAANNLNQAVHVARRALDASAIEVRDGMLRLAADVDIDRLERAAKDARHARRASAYRAALSIYHGELLPENRYDDWASEPREQLAALVEQLTRELAALPDGADPLPVETSSFVGRARELAQLKLLLAGTRLLTLAGAGGVGKTRLALALARDAGPAALVELAPIADGSRVPEAVAAALDVRAAPGQDVTDALIGHLGQNAPLLVVDNCEHVLDAAAGLVGTLLRSLPRLEVLATSREPLRIPGEVVFRVPSLDIPDPVRATEPEALLEYEAVRLFVDRARATAPSFTVDRDNAADVARICFRLDGLPLALELAAGRIGALSPAAIAERLDDRFRVLRNESRSAPTRQHTLAATLAWSHDLLEPDERKLFRRLSTFAGGFDLEAAEYVCAGDDLNSVRIADVLGRLVEKSLVAVDDARARDRRYSLLETVRIYARERLEEAGEAATMAERHARWALELAERERGSPRLDRDAANLRAALDTLLERAPDDALRCCVALRPFWMRRIDLHEAQRRFAETLGAASARTARRAQALLAAAAIDYRAGTLAQGLARAEESYAIAAEVGDGRAEWRALQFLGELGVAFDSPELATPWLDRALALARREGFAAAEAIGVYSLGVSQWILDDLPRAEELVARSLELLRPLAGSGELILSPVNIAEIRTGRRGLRMVFEDSLQPFAEISCDAAVSYMLANQAALVRARGDPARSRALLDESAARFDRAGDHAGTAAVLIRRAYLDFAEGALPAARAALEQALELRRGQQDRRGTGLVLAGLGFVATVAGDHAIAERHLAEAQGIFRRAGDRWGLASTLWRSADLALARGQLDEAQAALEEARAALGVTGRNRWIATTLTALADVAQLRGDRDRAAELLVEARERYAASDDAGGVAAVEQRLSTR